MLSKAPPASSLAQPPGQITDTLSLDLASSAHEFQAAAKPSGTRPAPPPHGGAQPDDQLEDDFDFSAGGQACGGHGQEEDDAVVAALKSFVDECASTGLFTPEEHAALTALLQHGADSQGEDEEGDGTKGGCDPVVRAAYMVSICPRCPLPPSLCVTLTSCLPTQSPPTNSGAPLGISPL